MEVLLSAMPETGLTALEALRITRTFGSLKALFCRYATAFRPIVERSSWAQALEADVEEWPML
jgi:hypothetical protein